MEYNGFEKEFFGQTVVDPLGLAVVLACAVAALVVPRRYALWPIIMVACFVAPAQRFVVFTLNFDMLRVMVLFGIARVVMKREWRQFVWTGLDYAVLVWAAYSIFAYVILYGGSADALKYKLGIVFDLLGMYFVFRMVVRDWGDLTSLTRGFALISIPVALAFAVENQTGHNLFAFMGGVPEITEVRDGRLRCQGAFAHPILAGVFWAGVLPLIAGQWWYRGIRRELVVVGTACSLAIVVFCASSTPITALVFILIGMLFFPLRTQMRWVRWGLLFATVGLHMVMKAPVWHLIARIGVVSGSTGYHRFNLIDAAINNFADWGLIGMTGSTERWGWGLGDCTNMYIAWGLHGGIGLLGLFVLIIALGFRGVGAMVKASRGNRERQILCWAIGLALLVHVTSFIGVSYFGQINVLWHLQLALIASLSSMPPAVSTVVRARQKRLTRARPLLLRRRPRVVSVGAAGQSRQPIA